MSGSTIWSGRGNRPWTPALLGMIAASAVALVAVVWLGWKIYQASQAQPPQPRFPYVPWLIFSIASAVVSLATGLNLWFTYKLAESEQTIASAEKANLLGWLALEAFIVAAALGVAPVIMEYHLNEVNTWFSRVNRGLSSWREWDTWRPIVFTLGGLLGMMLAFTGMVNEARENPVVRRLIYGYNTFLSAVLLLGILIVVNGIAFAYGTRPFDWTATGSYTVHERMQKLLRQLPAPVDVYVLIDPDDSLYPELRDYLELCRTYNREKFRVHYPYLRSSRELLQLMFQRYRVSPDQSGVLVVYDAESGRNAYQFIRRDDLRSESRLGREAPVFKAEGSLASALITLMQGPQKPVIYFTSGAGEMTPSHSREQRNLRRLKDRLEQQGYQVKEVDLTKRDVLGGPAPEVLQALMETELLIVADPLSAPPGYLDMLKLYMGPPASLGLPQTLALVQSALQGPLHLFDPATLDWFLIQQHRRGKGRLLIFTGAGLETNGTPTACAIETFLKDYGISAGRDLLFSLERERLLDVLVHINPQADQQLRAGLSPSQLETAFRIPLCRTIDSSPAGDYIVTTLLQTYVPVYPLQEQLLADQPELHLLEQFQRDRVGFKQRIKTPPHPVAVTVRERSSRVPRDPFHAGVAGEGAPRLVVFGSAVLALQAGLEDFQFNLVVSSLAWLRQRTELMDVGIPPRERKSFEPGPNFQRYSLLSYMVQGLMVFALVIVSGVGVYLVRRQ